MHGLIYLAAAVILAIGLVVLLVYRPNHPWRGITPLSNDERYLDWVERHAEWQRHQRVKKSRQRMRVLRRLDDRYAKRTSVHVP